MSLWKRLFCKHEEETEISFYNADAELCYMAFCCECGVLRYFEKFYKDSPRIQVGRTTPYGYTAKHITQYAKPGYNHNPIVFHDDSKQELWESGYFNRRTDTDEQAKE